MSTPRAGPAGSVAREAERLIAAGRRTEALGHLVAALAERQGGVEAARLLARLLGTYRLESSTTVEAAVRAACRFADFDLQPLVRSGIDSLLAAPAWAPFVPATGGAVRPQIEAALDAGSLAPFDDPLLGAILQRGVCHDLALERILVALRATLLMRPADTLPAGWLDVADALACQATNNEYAWPTGADEDAAVERLIARIADTPSPTRADLVRAAMYRPAAGAVDAEEPQLRTTIRKLGSAATGGSQSVQAQYEENPYPRWLALNPPRPGERRARLLARCPATARARFEGPLDVLIAGCGTGRQAVAAALGYGRPVRVTAIDLSAASLAYAARMARRYGLDDIEFVQVDLLDVDRLERGFDVIEAIGVLHHLPDPAAGWQALARRLKPGGLMNVAVYSERGRQDVVAARRAIADLGLDPTPPGIRRLRRLVLDAPPAVQDWRATVRRFTDFFTLSGCRDLLFNVLEHRFTPQALRAVIDAAGLEFLGLDVPAAVLARYRDRFPADPKGLDLALWDRFEIDNPATFSGMIGLWCRTRQKDQASE